MRVPYMVIRHEGSTTIKGKGGERHVRAAAEIVTVQDNER
jgi:hypothetical protein